MAEIKLGKFGGLGGVILLVGIVCFYIWQAGQLKEFLQRTAPEWVVRDLEIQEMQLGTIPQLNSNDFKVVSVKRLYRHRKKEVVVRVVLNGPETGDVSRRKLVYKLHVRGGPILGYRISRGTRE